MGTAPPIETGEAVGPTLGDILRKSKTKSNLQNKSLYLTEGFFTSLMETSTCFIFDKILASFH